MAAYSPLRLDVGEDEVLLDYAGRAAGGYAVTLAIWQGMPHVFQARCGELVAAGKSFDVAGGSLVPQSATSTNHPS